LTGKKISYSTKYRPSQTCPCP